MPFQKIDSHDEKKKTELLSWNVNVVYAWIV